MAGFADYSNGAEAAGSAPPRDISLQPRTVTLSCIQTDAKPGTAPETWTLRIDFSNRRVEELGPSGKAYENRIAEDARISENAIIWSAELMDTGSGRRSR